MDFSSSINPSLDYSSEYSPPPPLPSSSNAATLPSHPENRTPAPCGFADYYLNIKKGKSLYEYLGYSEPSIKLNPLSKKISTFIKGLGADWPTTKPLNSCHTALESRNFANQFLDEEQRGEDIWADPCGAKLWVRDEMEIRHVVHHIFIQKQKSTNIAWFKEQRKKRDEEEAAVAALTTSASGLFPKIKHEIQDISFDSERSSICIADSDAQYLSIARIETLRPRDEPLKELTRKWIWTNFARWPESANAALELLMHEKKYYIGWDDGSSTSKPGILQKLRDGTELQNFKDEREFDTFDRRLRKQVQVITAELQNLGFVDDDLCRCELFDTQWRRKKTIWKKIREEVRDKRNSDGPPEQHADYDSLEQDTLGSNHGIIMSHQNMCSANVSCVIQVVRSPIAESHSCSLVTQELGTPGRRRTANSNKRKRKATSKARQNNGEDENRPIRRRRILKASNKPDVGLSEQSSVEHTPYTDKISDSFDASLPINPSLGQTSNSDLNSMVPQPPSATLLERCSSFMTAASASASNSKNSMTSDEVRSPPPVVRVSSESEVPRVAPIANMMKQDGSLNIQYQSPYIESVIGQAQRNGITIATTNNGYQSPPSSLVASPNANLGAMSDKIFKNIEIKEHLAASDPKDSSRSSHGPEHVDEVDPRLQRPKQPYSTSWALDDVRLVVDSTPWARRLLLVVKLEVLARAARKRQITTVASNAPAAFSSFVVNPAAFTPTALLPPETALALSEDVSMGSMDDEDTPLPTVRSHETPVADSNSTLHRQRMINDVALADQTSSSTLLTDIAVESTLDPLNSSMLQSTSQATFPDKTALEDDEMPRMTSNLNSTLVQASSSTKNSPADITFTESSISESASSKAPKASAATVTSEPSNSALNNLRVLTASPEMPSSPALFLPPNLPEKPEIEARITAPGPDIPKVNGQYQLPGGVRDRISTHHLTEQELLEQQRDQATSSSKDLAVVAERNDRIKVQFVTNENEYTKSMVFECLENETLEGFFKLFSEQSGFPNRSVTKLKLEQDFGEARQFSRKFQISRNDSYAEWKSIKRRLFKDFQNALVSARNKPDFLDMQFLVVVDKV